jgi:hypothetical protein
MMPVAGKCAGRYYAGNNNDCNDGGNGFLHFEFPPLSFSSDALI